MMASVPARASKFISASAIGYYGETGNRAVTESDRGGEDFLSVVCREWKLPLILPVISLQLN